MWHLNGPELIFGLLLATSCSNFLWRVSPTDHGGSACCFSCCQICPRWSKSQHLFHNKIESLFYMPWFEMISNMACCRIIPRLCSSTISNFYISLELRIPLLTRHLYTFFVHCLAILNGPDWCSSAFSRHGFRGRSRHPPACMMWFLKQLTNDLSIWCSGAPLPQNARKKRPFPRNLRIHLLLFLRGAIHHAYACEFTYV